jgi:hypothetical protein
VTAEQLALDHAPVKVVRHKLPPEEQWRLTVADNPWLPAELAATARQLLDLGKRVSINRVFEECRERVHTVGDEFALNNTIRAAASRHLMAHYADLAGVFETRKVGRRG